MRKVQKLMPVAGLLLCLFVISPEYLMISSMVQMQSQPMMLSKRTEHTEKSVTAFNELYMVYETLDTETWTNGTKVHICEHFNETKQKEVWVNCTTWINSTKTSGTSKTMTYTAQPLASRSYPGKYIEDGFVWFLPKGNNGTCLVSYNHDDNYDAYPEGTLSYNNHPQEWYWEGEIQGQTKSHVHLGNQFIQDWINGVHDDTTTIGTVLALAGGATTLTLGILAAFFGIEVVGVPMIISGLVTIFGAILALLGFTKERWIRDVVRESFSGDGWYWMGAILRGTIIRSYDLYVNAIGAIWDYHEVRSWQESWGSEGIFPASPRQVSFSVYSRTEFKTGRTGVVPR